MTQIACRHVDLGSCPPIASLSAILGSLFSAGAVSLSAPAKARPRVRARGAVSGGPLDVRRLGKRSARLARPRRSEAARDVDLLLLVADGVTRPAASSHIAAGRLVVVSPASEAESTDWFEAPELTVRHVGGLRHPRALRDPDGKLPKLRKRALAFRRTPEVEAGPALHRETGKRAGRSLEPEDRVVVELAPTRTGHLGDP